MGERYGAGIWQRGWAIAGGRVRVLHCLAEIQSGGVEVRHLENMRALGPEFSHYFICTIADGIVAERIRDAGGVIHQLGPVSSVLDPTRFRRAISVARAWQPDIVHGAVMEGITLGAVISLALGIPFVAEETSDPQDRRWRGHLLARLAYARARRCVAVSAAVGGYLERLRVPRDKVRVIPNGVRPPDPVPEDVVSSLKTSLGIESDEVIVGTVSRIHDDHKRISDLLMGMSAVLDDGYSARLVVVGDGPDLSTLKHFSNRLGIGHRVDFVGRHQPADAFYSIMDVFALVSQREAFGLVIAEAMFHGLPVVATAVGGIPEIVVDGVTGILVPPRAPGAIAVALRQLLENPELRTELGMAGWQRARIHFSANRQSREVERLYREICPL